MWGWSTAVHTQHYGFDGSDTIKLMMDRWACLVLSGIWLNVQFLLRSASRPREKAMAPHSSTLAWKIPWMEEPGRLQSMGSLESDMNEWLHFHFSLSFTGEGNGNPLQRSCLENPRDGGAWWAAVYGVTQNRTRLKWLSSSSSSRPRVISQKVSSNIKKNLQDFAAKS